MVELLLIVLIDSLLCGAYHLLLALEADQLIRAYQASCDLIKVLLQHI